MSKLGLQIEITAPGGVPPSIPATAAAIKSLNGELQKSLDIERQKFGKFSGTPQIVLEETRARRMRERAQDVPSRLPSAGGSASQERTSGPSWAGMATAIEKAAPRIERAAHSMALLKMAAETESFQGALEKLGPSFKSLFNDITTGLTGAVFAAQGIRNIASLTGGMTAAQGLTAGAAGLGLVGVALMKVSADAAVEMSNAKGDQTNATGRMFDTANADAKSVPTMEQLNKLIERIGSDAGFLNSTGQMAEGKQMQTLALGLLANREAVLQRNQKAAADKAAAEEVAMRDALVTSTAAAWGEHKQALDEATAAIKREALAREPLAVRIKAAQDELKKEQQTAARRLAVWEKELASSGVDAATKADARLAKQDQLQLPVTQAQAELDRLNASDGIKTGSTASFMASVRAQMEKGSWDGSANVKTPDRTFRLDADSAIRQGLSVGNVRSSLEVSSGQTLVGLQREANGLLKQVVAKTEAPSAPTYR